MFFLIYAKSFYHRDVIKYLVHNLLANFSQLWHKMFRRFWLKKFLNIQFLRLIPFYYFVEIKNNRMINLYDYKSQY